MIIDGYPTCDKCGREIRYGNDCKYCGINQLVYREGQMIVNLKKFGFIPVNIYKKQNFLQKLFFDPVIEETIYTYQLFVAKKIDNNSNRVLFFRDKKIDVLNEYGDFSWVCSKWIEKIEPYMKENNSEMIKQNRNKKLDQLI